jgi:hypothetical protein
MESQNNKSSEAQPGVVSKRVRKLRFKKSPYIKRFVRHNTMISDDDVALFEFGEDVDYNEIWNESEPLSDAEYSLALELNELKALYIHADRQAIHMCAERYDAVSQQAVNKFKIKCLEIIDKYHNEELVFEILKPMGFIPTDYFSGDAVKTNGIHHKIRATS